MKFIGLSKQREELYSLINQRVDKMVEDGLVEEVKSLMEQYPISLRAFQAIGYKELMEGLKTTPLSDIINLIKFETKTDN